MRLVWLCPVALVNHFLANPRGFLGVFLDFPSGRRVLSKMLESTKTLRSLGESSLSPKACHPKAGRSGFRNHRFKPETGKMQKMRMLPLTPEEHWFEDIPQNENAENADTKTRKMRLIGFNATGFGRHVPPCAVKTCAVHPVFAWVVGELRAADPSKCPSAHAAKC